MVGHVTLALACALAAGGVVMVVPAPSVWVRGTRIRAGLGREASAGLVDGLLSARAFLAVAALCAVAALAILLVLAAGRATYPRKSPCASPAFGNEKPGRFSA